MAVFSRRDFLSAASVTSLLAFAPSLSQARFPRGSSSGNNRKAQVNLGPGDISSKALINLFNSQNFNYSGGATPAALDADFYPVRNFSGVISMTQYYVDNTLSTTGPWIFKWDAGRGNFKINFGKAATVTTLTGSPSITNGSGSGNLSIMNTGSAGSVSIIWNDTTGPSMQFDGTNYTSWNSNTSGKMGIYRSSDAAAYAAGTYWTPEFVTLISNLNARSIRPMGWNILRGGSQDSNEAQWTNRRRPNALTFVTDAYPPGARSGGATSFGTITWDGSTGLYTAAASDDTTAGTWNAGDTIVGSNSAQANRMMVTGAVAKTGTNAGKVQLTVGSTTGLVVSNTVENSGINGTTEANGRQTILSVDSSTTFTINATFVNAFATSPLGCVGYQRLAITGKTGTKLILNDFCLPMLTLSGYSADLQDVLAGNATYVYDAILDAVVYTSGGISQAFGGPIEAQVQLANLCNVNYWYNLPTYATDDYVTQSANLVYGLLNSQLKLEYEYTNEPWNNGQPAAKCMFARSVKLGLPSGNDYTALRIRQINGNLLPASNWSTAMGRLVRLYMTQGGSSMSDFGVLDFLAGSNLASYGYNVVGQRPVDVSDSIGYAPYLGGGTALSGQSPDIAQIAPTIYDAPVLQAIADYQNAGNTAAAYALIDDCIKWGRNRVQTVTWDSGNSRFVTPLAHNFVANDLLRFSVTGGTIYSGLNVQKLYRIIAVPTTATFTVGEVVHNSFGSAVNAGSAGSGTTSVGSTGFADDAQVSIFNVTSTFFTKWEFIAAFFDASRATVGLPPVKVEWYEGSTEFTAPTTTQCFNIGVTLSGDPTGASAAAALATAVSGYKNSSYGSTIIQQYYNAFMGTDPAFISYGAMPHSAATAQLVLMCGGVYALVANADIVNPTPYQTYYGFAAFSAS